MLIGSCFSTNVGDVMERYQFDCVVNPHGVMYNPLALARCLHRLAEPTSYTQDDLAFVEQTGRWVSVIKHDGTRHCLGTFVDEHEAARAYDTAARRLRPEGEAHGGRSGHTGSMWRRLNFPTAAEESFAEGEGMPPTKKQKV